MQRKVLDEVKEQLDIEADKDINNAEPPKSQMSLRNTVSQFMTIWNGPMADFYYAQQKAFGHVVEGMRLRFQIRGQICCLVNVFEAWVREAMVLPPSLVDSSESNQCNDTLPPDPHKQKHTKLTTTTDNKCFNFLCVSKTHESLGGPTPYTYIYIPMVSPPPRDSCVFDTQKVEAFVVRCGG